MRGFMPRADRHINVGRVVHMFRVVATVLLFAAAALAAVDLSGLVDFVYNTTSPLERFTPTYVFEIDGCKALVYMVDPTLKNSPLETWRRDYSRYDPTHYSRTKSLRPLTSAEAEKLLNALYQVLGPSAGATVTGRTENGVWFEGRSVEAVDAAQLVEKLREVVEVDFYLGAADDQKASEKGAGQEAYLYQVHWIRGDLTVFFTQDYSSARLEVWTANLSAAVETLKKVKEAAGELWNSVAVILWHGPYHISDYARKDLIRAAFMLEEELGGVWDSKGGEGQRKHVLVHVDFPKGLVGPLYVTVEYPSGTMPDSATAERLVRRFVELSGFCKSPLVVEFWPRPELPPTWLFAVVGAALAVAVGLLVLTRRRR